MNFIGLSFLQEQPFEQIRPSLEYLSKAIGAQVGLVCLVHGFPAEGNVADSLKELFPIQMNCYNDGNPQLDIVASVIKQNDGIVYSIGQVNGDLQKEVIMYQECRIFVGNLPLNFNGEGGIPERPETEGEYRVRVKFNAAGTSLVSDIKKIGARFINSINDMDLGRDLNERDKQSFGRLKSLAMTEAEHSTSDAVKAATTGLN